MRSTVVLLSLCAGCSVEGTDYKIVKQYALELAQGDDFYDWEIPVRIVDPELEAVFPNLRFYQVTRRLKDRIEGPPHRSYLILVLHQNSREMWLLRSLEPLKPYSREARDRNDRVLTARVIGNLVGCETCSCEGRYGSFSLRELQIEGDFVNGILRGPLLGGYDFSYRIRFDSRGRIQGVEHQWKRHGHQ